MGGLKRFAKRFLNLFKKGDDMEDKFVWHDVKCSLPVQSFQSVLCTNGHMRWIGYIVYKEDDNDSYLYECGYIKQPLQEYKWFIVEIRGKPLETLEVMYWMPLPDMPILSVQEEYISNQRNRETCLRDSKEFRESLFTEIKF